VATSAGKKVRTGTRETETGFDWDAELAAALLCGIIGERIGWLLLKKAPPAVWMQYAGPILTILAPYRVTHDLVTIACARPTAAQLGAGFEDVLRALRANPPPTPDLCGALLFYRSLSWTLAPAFGPAMEHLMTEDHRAAEESILRWFVVASPWSSSSAPPPQEWLTSTD